jgi:UPF0755 protein
MTNHKYNLLLVVLFSIIIISCKEKKEPVIKVVINKERTREEVAKRLANQTKKPVEEFLNILLNNDSLKALGKDSATIMSAIIPNTYEVYKKWNALKIIKKITEYESKFWNATRKEQAEKLKLTPHQVVTLASIVEEETNKNADKGNIASVYYNRLQKGMTLSADPTIKYALKDFAKERIYFKDIANAKSSLYSTYAFKGLPPGPICTPSTVTIDAVLNLPQTDYLFFVAQPNFSGLSNFTNNYPQHQVNAKVYQKFLDSLFLSRKNKK